MADENECPTPAEQRTADAQPEHEARLEVEADEPQPVWIPRHGHAQADYGDAVYMAGRDLHVEYSPGVDCPSKDKRRPIESADEALKRGAEPEAVNEILAGGAVAASFTAAASVAKAKLEATTQRRKNDLAAETERLRISSEERIAGFQTMRAQVEAEGPDFDNV